MNKRFMGLAITGWLAACGSTTELPPAGQTPAAADGGVDATAPATCTATSCNGHGTCDATSGAIVCTCEAGYGGATCTECAAGFQDKDGNKTCATACETDTCSGHGTCDDASGTAACTCDDAYAGANCESCAPDFQDKDGDKTCTAACGADTCSGHGTCDDTTGTATCTCEAEYTGPACAACATDFQDKDDDKVCTAACKAGPGGTCNDHGACDDATGTATCTCDPHFAPPTCATCLPNFTGAACDTCVTGKGGANCDYSIVYGLNIPTAADYNIYADVPYDIDNSAGAGAFTRVAFRMVLDAEEVWVEMDAFTNDATKLGLPVDWVFDQTVSNLTVASKAANVTSIAAPTTGILELWSNCYGTTGGNNGTYDYDDDPNFGTDCYGSFQVHVGTNTILAYNRWSGGGNSDIGFGNSPTGQPDWTFRQNAASFATRRLEVYIK